MCSVPNAFVCIEVKVIIRILSFTRFFKHTAIILNTAVLEYFLRSIKKKGFAKQKSSNSLKYVPLCIEYLVGASLAHISASVRCGMEACGTAEALLSLQLVYIIGWTVSHLSLENIP